MSKISIVLLISLLSMTGVMDRLGWELVFRGDTSALILVAISKVVMVICLVPFVFHLCGPKDDH
jgi:hypothetical protein